jgi:hypothetical protein
MSKKPIYNSLSINAIFQQKTINLFKNNKSLIQAKETNIVSINYEKGVILSSSKNSVGQDIFYEKKNLRNLTNRIINVDAVIHQTAESDTNVISLLRKRFTQIKNERSKKATLLLSSKKGGFNAFFLGSKAFYPRSQSVPVFKKIQKNYTKCKNNKQRLISATKIFSNPKVSIQTNPVKIPFQNAKFTLYPRAKTINFAKKNRRYNKNNPINFVFAHTKNTETYEINKKKNSKKTNTNKHTSKTSNNIKKSTGK